MSLFYVKHTTLVLSSLSLSSTLQTTSIVASIVTSLSQSHVSRLLLHLRSNGHELGLGSHLLHRHEHTSELSGSSHLLSRRISLLRLGALREQNQLALVSVQSLDVGLESLDGLVHSSVINGNTDRSSLIGVNSSLLHN